MLEMENVMTEYRAIYKCRLCGEEFEKEKVDYKRAIAAVLCLGMFGNESFDDSTTDISVCRVIDHNCKDGSMGLADFLGFRKVEDGNESD